MECYSAIKTKQNKTKTALCGNMDGTRYSHTEGSKQESERQMPYDITYTWNLKYMQMNLSKKEIMDLENSGCQGGGGGSGMDVVLEVNRCRQ